MKLIAKIIYNITFLIDLSMLVLKRKTVFVFAKKGTFAFKINKFLCSNIQKHQWGDVVINNGKWNVACFHCETLSKGKK